MAKEFKSAVLDEFFKKWEAETFDWYVRMYNEYREDKRAFEEKYNIGTYFSKISKANMELIRWSQLEPREHCGLSIRELVARDMQAKKVILIKKIMDKVGEVVEVDLDCGMDGTPNGRVVGTLKTVRIETIMAGGYNVQCLHYRVLVK